MALSHFFPHRFGRNYWDVWDWPQSMFNQHFGLDLQEYDDLHRGLSRPSRREIVKKSGLSEVMSDANKFEVKVDVAHFKPEEIEVKIVNNAIVIHGKHEERMDDHGWISREFTRKYVIPQECEVDKVSSSLTGDGILTIEAPKKAIENVAKDERVIPITVQKKTLTEPKL